MEEIATICAMLSTENVFFYPRRLQSRYEEKEDAPKNGAEKRGKGGVIHRSSAALPTAEEEIQRHAVEDAHRRLTKTRGDHFTLLNIYDKWGEAGPKSPLFNLYSMYLYVIRVLNRVV
jgi:HrpA-like RNA helicase